MRLLLSTVFMALLCAVLFVFSNCGKSRGPSSPAVSSVDDPAASVQPASRGQPQLTAEDEMLLKIPYEQRVQYLRQRYRELVFELHSVKIDDDDGGKSASGDDPDHMVCKYDTIEDVPREDLKLLRAGDSWQWNLSFSERLCGDYDWSGTVAIADITPLARWFNSHQGEEDWLGAPYNIDRLGDDNGRITIADITPLAQNFGKRLVGYNVYFLPYGHNDWESVREQPIAKWRRKDTGNWENTGYRTKWKSDPGDEGTPVRDREFSGAYLCRWAGRDHLTTGDQLTVLPVFLNALGQEEVGSEEMRSDVVTISVPPDTPPVAEISAGPLVGAAPLEVTLTGSYTDEDREDRILAYEFGIYRVANGGEEHLDDISEKEGDESFDGVMYYTFGQPGIYRAKLTVTTGNENHEGSNLEPAVSEEIRATGRPSIESFTASPHPPLDEPLEVPVEVTFTAVVQDTDLIGITGVWFDYLGNGNWIAADTLELLEPEEDYRYVAASVREFTADDLDGSHSNDLPCQMKAEDSAGPSFMSLVPPLPIAHAVPHLVLATTPSPAYIFAGQPVEFDASASYDRDGPGGKPTKYDFILEEGNRYSETEGNAPDGSFDGKHTFTNCEAGLYTAIVRVYDEDYDTCNEPLEHVDEATVEVRVYGEPVWLRNELVDDGDHPGDTWTQLGQCCIALDINPATGWPGIVYSAKLESHGGSGDTRPQDAPLYTDKQEAVGGWRDPESSRWPLPVWFPADPKEKLAHIGDQCDLMYHRTIVDKQTADYYPVVAATIWSQSGEPVPPSAGKLKHYDCTLPPWRMNPWTGTWLVDYAAVDLHSPIRLVVNDYGSFVNYRHILDTDPPNRLNEVQAGSNPVTVEMSASGDVGVSHDFKPVLSLRADGTWGPHPWAAAALYTYTHNGVEILGREVNVESYSWGDPSTEVSGSITIRNTRNLALDYFQDSLAGYLWVDDGCDLAFYQTGWGTAQFADYDVGDWCDFDYDEGLGIPCVAYEKIINGKAWVLFQAFIDEDWLEEAGEIANLGEDGVSHLDLDVYNGYVYIAYSDVIEDEIRCAVLDFFAGNR